MDRENSALAHVLERAGWTPERLATELTRMFEAAGDTRRVHAKTPYTWLRGKVPRPPMPEMAALALSDELGENVPAEVIWPTAAKRPPQWLPATAGLGVPWTQVETVDVLGKWVRYMRRREFVAVSGAALTAPVWDWVEATPAALTVVNRGSRVTPEVVDAVGDHIRALRRLDDVHGGNPATLRYLGAQFDLVADLIAHGSYDGALGRRLLVALGELGQIGGLMAMDAGRPGQAQRYFLNGLRATHAAGDRPLGLNIVSFMISHSVHRGKARDALQLATAAEKGMKHLTSNGRALIEGRIGGSHALAGDLSGFRRHREQVLEWYSRRQVEPDPPWAYYVSQASLNATAGRSLVLLARQMPPAKAKRLLAEATSLLHARAYLGADQPYQRDSLIYGAWLALAHVHAGELEQATEAGRVACSRLTSATSVLGTSLLRRVADNVNHRWPRERRAHEFVAELDRALATTP